MYILASAVGLMSYVLLIKTNGPIFSLDGHIYVLALSWEGRIASVYL